MNRLIALILIAAAGCVKSPSIPAVPPAVRGQTGAQASSRMPADVQVVVKEASAHRVILLARVAHLPSWKASIHVTVRVPDNVVLESGDADWTASPDDPASSEKKLAFVVQGKPGGDIDIEADARGADFGWHLKRQYLFQPKPPLPRIEANGAAVRVGARDYGASIELQ